MHRLIISFPFRILNRALLGDATISSKIDPLNGSKKEKKSYCKVRAVLKIL